MWSLDHSVGSESACGQFESSGQTFLKQTINGHTHHRYPNGSNNFNKIIYLGKSLHAQHCSDSQVYFALREGVWRRSENQVEVWRLPLSCCTLSPTLPHTHTLTPSLSEFVRLGTHTHSQTAHTSQSSQTAPHTSQSSQTPHALDFYSVSLSFFFAHSLTERERSPIGLLSFFCAGSRACVCRCPPRGGCRRRAAPH